MVELLFYTPRAEDMSSRPFSFAKLDWLPGAWEGPIGDAVLEESWLPSRTVTKTPVVRLATSGMTNLLSSSRTIRRKVSWTSG